MRTGQLIAVLCAVLLVSSSSVVAVTFSDHTPETQRQTADPNAEPSSSLAYRNEAISSFSNTTLPGEGVEKQELLNELDNTTSSYIDENRTTNPPFETDRRVVALTQQRAPDVADSLVASDSILVATAIDDAEQALSILDQRNVSFDVQETQDDITAAQKAYRRGERLRDNSPVGAIAQYQTAWERAQAALDRMDRAVEPEVQITFRRDLPHEPNVTYPVQGTVFDVRPYELDSVNITLNNETVATAPINASSKPVTNGTFGTNISISSDLNVITVNATDPNRDLSDRIQEDDTDSSREDSKEGQESEDGEGDEREGPPDDRGNGRGPPDSEDEEGEDEEDEEEESEGEDEQGATAPATGSDSLLLDADGLPDTFEQSVVGTDPFDTDSDSARTDIDEADNGTIDGLEDFDSDGLTTYQEFRGGTDPLLNDTDGDGLIDGFEVQFGPLNPLAADTDKDGTDDGAEDFDGDGLSTRTEQRIGSNPFSVDSDGDSINDDIEQSETGTDPAAADTDTDGLDDGAELSVGTDPLNPDTDADGTLDGNETFTTVAENNSIGASVTVTGSGAIADGVTIERQTDPLFDSPIVENQSVAPLVSLNSEQAFDNATITIEYDEDKVSDANTSELAIFRYNETLQNFVPINSTVDTSTGTVSATVSEFSTFTVFSVPNWGAQFEAEIPEPGEGDSETQSVDVAFVIDSSGSIQDTDPNGFRKTAAKRFVGALLDRDRAAVIDFDSDAQVLQNFTSDFDSVNSSIDQLDAFGGTSIARGIRAANGEFDAASDESRAKVMILLTDGFAPREPARTAAAEAADRNITIYTIGFGNPDSVLLEDIAQTTGGQFFEVENASDLPEVFSRVAENATGPTDSDGDGIVDSLERRGIPIAISGFIPGRLETSPRRADSDDDGLSDGEELEKTEFTKQIQIGPNEYTYEVSYYRIKTDPTDADTDDDFLLDGEELNVWDSDPQNSDTEGDGFVDIRDPRINQDDSPAAIRLKSRSGQWGRFAVVKIIETSDTSIEARARYKPAAPWDNPFWSTERVDFEFLAPLQCLDNEVPQEPFICEDRYNQLRNAYPIERDDDYVLLFDKYGVLDEDPTKYQINITNDGGIKVSYTISVSESGAARITSATVVAAGVSYATPVPFDDIPVTLVAGAVLLGVGVYVVGTTVYDAVTGSTPPVESKNIARDIDVSETAQEYPSPAYPTVSPRIADEVELPLRLPSGHDYEAPTPIGDQVNRDFGGEQIIRRLPGVTSGNVDETIGQVVRAPSAVRQDGEYTVVIGDNPNGPGGIALWIDETGLILQAAQTSSDYRGNQIIIGDAVEKINNEDDWDHNKLGNNKNEIQDNVEKVLNNPSEVYEQPSRSNDGKTVTVYVKEFFIDGDEVIVFALVVNGELITAFVPADEAPSGSNYEDAYDRDEAIEYIIEDVLKDVTGSDTIEKIEEFEEVIEQIDVGDEI